MLRSQQRGRSLHRPLDAMKEDPSRNRRALRESVKRRCSDEDEQARQKHLLNLPRQGEMCRIATPSAAIVWANALESLPSESFKFALNASHDTLPHNANLHLWRKKGSDLCPLCGERQTLLHVLNACNTALNLRRYNDRHDAVLRELYCNLKPHFPPSMSTTADLDNYCFPHHIVSTDLRPDIVCWDESRKAVWFIELTVCFESCFQAAADRKEVKYLDIATSAAQAGYNTEVITVEIGSRGLPHTIGFNKLETAFNIPAKDLRSLQIKLSQTAILGSHHIWCSRNRQNPLC